MSFLLLLVLIENIFVENIRKYMFGLTPQTPACCKIWKMFSVAEQVLFGKCDRAHFGIFSTHSEVLWYVPSLCLRLPLCK